MKDNLTFSRQQVLSLASQVISGSAYKPNPDDPEPPSGPWGPVIRRASRNALFFADTSSIILKVIAQRDPRLWEILGGPLSLVALNPQPLPPGIPFALSLAQEVIDRVLLMQDIADAMHPDTAERGILIVGRYINSFVDDLCPVPPKIKLPKKKSPYPVPPTDVDPGWPALELAVIGMEFRQAANATDNESLKKAFLEAGEKILDVGFSRL